MKLSMERWNRSHSKRDCSTSSAFSLIDAVSRQLLARAWAAGPGPGAEPFTIDLDATICETYGLQQEGGQHHGYSGARLSPAARGCRRDGRSIALLA